MNGVQRQAESALQYFLSEQFVETGRFQVSHANQTHIHSNDLVERWSQFHRRFGNDAELLTLSRVARQRVLTFQPEPGCYANRRGHLPPVGLFHGIVPSCLEDGCADDTA